MYYLRFNKASLVNVGFLESASECDYMAIHDIDLLPMNDELSYEFPHTGVFHVSASGLHPDYNYTTFIGGILLLQNRHFGLVGVPYIVTISLEKYHANKRYLCAGWAK